MRFPRVVLNLRLTLGLAYGFGFFPLAASLLGSTPWQKATTEELAQTESTLQPGVAAEAILRRIDIDDSAYPAGRTIKEYVRYKVYDPAKADRIMRLSKNSVSIEGIDFQSPEMKARLTQPDGSIREFGPESIHERQIVKDSNSDSFIHRVFGSEGLEMKEKFIAIGGALPGAILEFQITLEEESAPLTTFLPIQLSDIPIRRFEYSIESTRNSDAFAFQLFALNARNGELKGKKISTFTATNLPALRREPLSGAPAYYAATMVINYTQTQVITQKSTAKTRHFSPDTPWASVATLKNWLEAEHVTITNTVKRTATEITAGAPNDEEKARRIHDYTAKLYVHYARSAKNLPKVLRSTDVVSMDDVIDFEKQQPDKIIFTDFLWLEISLMRSIGLNAEAVMVPNRQAAPFNRTIVSTAFLPNVCVGVKVGSSWHFSFPINRPVVAFDELPWPFEGQGGLLALDNKQEFVDIPLREAEHSGVTRTGRFRLEADGSLIGECKMTLTGHEALPVRGQLAFRPPDRQRLVARTQLRRQMPGVDIEVTDVANVDDPYKPTEISYRVRWPNFAVSADQRLIIQPFLFRAHAAAPFAASERTYPVVFAYPHQESDVADIALPAGYELEVKNAPPSAPGKLLSYSVQLVYNPKTRVLHAERKFSNSLISVDLKNYPALKQWFDEISASDQHPLVLVKTQSSPSNPSPTASAP